MDFHLDVVLVVVLSRGHSFVLTFREGLFLGGGRVSLLGECLSLVGGSFLGQSLVGSLVLVGFVVVDLRDGLGSILGSVHLVHGGREGPGHVGLSLLEFLDLFQVGIELDSVLSVHLVLNVLEYALDLLAVGLLDVLQLFHVGGQVLVYRSLFHLDLLLHAAVLQLEVALFVLATAQSEFQVLVLLRTLLQLYSLLPVSISDDLHLVLTCL